MIELEKYDVNSWQKFIDYTSDKDKVFNAIKTENNDHFSKIENKQISNGEEIKLLKRKVEESNFSIYKIDPWILKNHFNIYPKNNLGISLMKLNNKYWAYGTLNIISENLAFSCNSNENKLKYANLSYNIPTLKNLLLKGSIFPHENPNNKNYLIFDSPDLLIRP